MAFALNLRRLLNPNFSAPFIILRSHLTSIRFTSTLTSPKLFISGLSRLTTEEKLEEAFEPYGQLLEAKVIKDRATGRSKGFGFITYSSIEEAEKAREEMNAKYLDGWVIFVDPAKPREPRFPPLPEQQQQPSETGFRVNKTVGWCGN
ncbi:hypothetical protein V2J09_004245 [Rumex salicifolius]